MIDEHFKGVREEVDKACIAHRDEINNLRDKFIFDGTASAGIAFIQFGVALLAARETKMERTMAIAAHCTSVAYKHMRDEYKVPQETAKKGAFGPN